MAQWQNICLACTRPWLHSLYWRSKRKLLGPEHCVFVLFVDKQQAYRAGKSGFLFFVYVGTCAVVNLWKSEDDIAGSALFPLLLLGFWGWVSETRGVQIFSTLPCLGYLAQCVAIPQQCTQEEGAGGTLPGRGLASQGAVKSSSSFSFWNS